MYQRQDNSTGDNDAMTRSSSQVPPWLVRAEVTIRHGDTVTSETVRMPPGITTTTTDAGGIRMICRWNTSEPSNSTTTTPTINAFSSSSSSSAGFGFQRGNILFTSTPPERPSFHHRSSNDGSCTLPRSSNSSVNDDSVLSRDRRNDSGYNSERFSSRAYSASLPARRSSQQYNRRCKSTCRIVLSTNPEKIANSGETSIDSWPDHRPSSSSYQRLFRQPFNAVPEVCEDCAEGSASSAFTTHFCTRVAEKSSNNQAIAISRDAASQTTDIESTRSSSSVAKSSKVGKRLDADTYKSDERKKKEEIRSPSASVETTSSVPSFIDAVEKSDTSSKENNSGKRKSRTVHIDVYCTGSDDDISTTSEDDDERGTPMTVFENEDVKVTHTQATNNLPRGFQDANAFLKRSAERRCASFRNAPMMRMPSLASSKGYDSDEMLSSLYPSRFSSYSGIRDLDSAPWSAASSVTALSPCDSTTITSTKDTFSDIESLINSKFGLTSCDSFEYANSADRDRIRRMDILAKTSDEKKRTWRSPQIERKHLLQNRKMKEYLEKHDIGWSSEEESAENSDENGPIDWNFITGDDKSLVKKNSIVRRSYASKDQMEESNVTRGNYVPHSYVLRDRVGPFGSNSPSPLPSTIPSRVTSPFAALYGERTDHIIKASRFGTVISAFRKPGHHIGPSKNPTCSCEHCRRYFEKGEARERAYSLSELERHPVFKSRKE